jgi:hypothetical protein
MIKTLLLPQWQKIIFLTKESSFCWPARSSSSQVSVHSDSQPGRMDW